MLQIESINFAEDKNSETWKWGGGGEGEKCGKRRKFNTLTLYPIDTDTLTHQQHTALENIIRKGEIAHNKQFLLFPRCFLLNQVIISPFVHIFEIISLFAAEFEEPRIGISGKGKMLVASIFFFSHHTFKRFLPSGQLGIVW